jgi:putative ABC transport system permease protein
MRELFARIVGLFRAPRETELDDEVRFHIEMLAQEHMRRGLDADEARRAALRTFGGVTQMKEAYREQQSVPLIETALLDIRYGTRALLRTPGFTLAALLTLALGIGANSAIFSVVNAVLLKPIPYADPDRIVQMFRNNRGLQAGLDARRFQFYQEQMKSFEALTAWRGTAFNMFTGQIAEYLPALAVSKEYFRVFGGTPVHGRTFAPEEDLPNGPDVVILTHGLWRRSFGSNPSVVGTTVSLGDKPYEVVGVMPEEFDSLRDIELYVPLKPSPTGPGGGFNYTVAGRLNQGITGDQANAESELSFAAFMAALPPNVKLAKEGPPWFLPYQESLARSVRPALLMMLGAVGMLLLIACANTASLLVARACGRSREMSVRAALGAGRSRIIRQLVTESIPLFVVGGLLGVALAYWTLPALLAMAPEGYLPTTRVRIDWTVLAVTLGASVLTGLLFGLVPALSASRQDLVGAFKDDVTRTTFSRHSNWMRRALVVAEISLCMLLLVGAGLLIQTFMRLRAVDVGFDSTNVLTARMSLTGERYSTADAVNRLYEQGLERLRGIPGVQSAAVVNSIPIEQGLNLNFDKVETREVEFHLTDWRYATFDYFNTLGVSVVQGRAFNDRDGRGAPRVAIVSEQFAHRYYPAANPIGRQVVLFEADGPIEIVGIVKDLRDGGLTGRVPAVMYVPVTQASDAAIRTSHLYFQASWVVRTAGASPGLRERITEELRAIDPRQPITAFRSIDEVKARAMQTESFQMTLLSVFAAIGLSLAAAGIYGLVAYSVAQRTREIGIRMALGASRWRILVSVLRQGAILAVIGVLVGSVMAAAMTRTLQSFVFGVSTLHAATFLIVAAILVVVAVVASFVPSLRALRLNPVTALRQT